MSFSAGTGIENIAQSLLHCRRALEYPDAELARAYELDLAEMEPLHVRLFINDRGGVKAAPFAGEYLPNAAARRTEFMQRISHQARALGFEIDHRQPPDSIPLLLELVALMLREYEAGSLGACALGQFCDEFLNVWPQGFRQALETHDNSGFYLSVAERIESSLNSIAQEVAT